MASGPAFAYYPGMVSGALQRWRSWLPAVCTAWAIGWLWGEPLALAVVVPLAGVGVFWAVRNPLPGAVVVLVAHATVHQVGVLPDNPAVLLSGVTSTFLLGYAVEARFGLPVLALYVAVILTSDMPLAGQVIGVGIQLAVWVLGWHVRRAGRAASEARSQTEAWQDADVDGRVQQIVARERRRMELEVLEALRTSVAQMRTIAVDGPRVDVAALHRVHALAQSTVEDLRTLLVTLRSVPVAPPPAPDDAAARTRRWRDDAIVTLAIVILAAVDAVLVGRVIPHAPVLAWIGLLSVVALPWRRSAPVFACVLATVPLLVAHATGTELIFGLATLMAFGLLAWSAVAERQRNGVVACALLCAAVILAPTHPDTLYPLVTASLVVFAVISSVVWHQFVADRDRSMSLVQEYESALMMRAGPVLAEVRRALARDLHDAVSRTVGVVAIQAEAACALAAIDPVRARHSADIVAGAASRADVELERLRHVLRDDVPDGPTPLRRSLADAEALGLRVETRIETSLTDVAVATTIYHVIAEALANAAKYAPGARVLLHLRRTGGSLCLTIADDGGNIPASQPPGTGFGLLSQAERVERLGGRLWTSAAGDGFAVQVQIPLTEGRAVTPPTSTIAEVTE